MPKFSTRSIQRLETCHRDLQVIFNEVVQHFDCTVVCGHRGEAEQNEAYNAGNSKLRFPQSKHNKTPSMAVDVVPYPIDWNDTDRMRYFAGVVKGIAALMYRQGTITHQLRWGGDWDRDTEVKDNKFQDLPHFELI